MTNAGDGGESNSSIKSYRAALDVRITQSPTSKTTIPEAKTYVGGDCSTPGTGGLDAMILNKKPNRCP